MMALAPCIHAHARWDHLLKSMLFTVCGYLPELQQTSYPERHICAKQVSTPRPTNHLCLYHNHPSKLCNQIRNMQNHPLFGHSNPTTNLQRLLPKSSLHLTQSHLPLSKTNNLLVCLIRQRRQSSYIRRRIVRSTEQD